MRNTIILVLLVFFGFAVRVTAQEAPATALGSPESVQMAVQAELRSVVEQYFVAYQKKDLEAMMALWSSHSPDVASTRQAASRFFEANGSLGVTKLTIAEAVLDGENKARVRVSMEIRATDVKTGMAAEGSGKTARLFDLVKEEGEWKLWQEIDATERLAAALLSSASKAERTALLQKERDSVGPHLIQALVAQGSKLRVTGEAAKAIAVFSFAGQLAEEIGDEAGLTTSYRNIGMVYRWKGDYGQAKEWSQKSLAIAERVHDPRLIANSLCDLGIDQSKLGDLSAAMESYQRSLELAEPLHDSQTMVRLFGNMGNLLLTKGEFAQAEGYFQRALEVQEKLGNNPALISALLTSLGAVAYSQNSDARAMAYYQRALPLAEKAENLSILPYALTGIGNLLVSQGNQQDALDYYRRSLAVSRKLGTKDTIRLALEDIGVTEISTNELNAALKNLTACLVLSREMGDKAVTAGLLGEIGEVHRKRGDYKAALLWVKKGVALADELGLQLETAVDLNRLSFIYRRLGQFEKASAAAERASEIARKIGSRHLIANARDEVALAFRAMGRPGQAKQALQEAIDAVESMRFDVAGGEQAKQTFLESRITPYQEMASLLVAQNRASEALAVAERAKGRVLLDVLRLGKVRSSKAMNDVERDQERDLDAELVSLNSQVQKAEREPKPDQQALDSLKTRLDQARIRYDQFLIALYAKHPELKSERGQASPIILEQTAELLRDSRSALLEFMIGEERSYLFVITRRSTGAILQLHVYPLHIHALKLAKKAEEFRRMLAARAPDFQVLGKQLYQLLLAPAQKQLAGKDMLVVVPDGTLWNLPFQALVQEDSRYLIEQYAIAYAPSLTVLREIERAHKNNNPAKETSPASTLLAMADPVLEQQTLAHASFAYRGEKLGPLPDARREVQALKQFYPGPESEIDVGEEAREDRFKAEAGKFRILHLASHAVLDNASPMYSNILLSPGDSGSEDGLLEAREIIQMDLHANLVVLSACETARGHIAPGEGVIGLTWAFFLAGTPTMVVSQWRVESSSTAALMLSFHRSLNPAPASGMAEVSVAKALQKAEIQTLRKPGYAHPFYWAGFVVMGDPGVIATH